MTIYNVPDTITCYSCAAAVTRTRQVHYWGGEHDTCIECITNRAFTCYACQENYSTASFTAIEGDGYLYCPDCASDQLETCPGCDYYEDNCHCGSSSIHSYSYKPNPIFHGDNLLQMGIELETEWTPDGAFSRDYDTVASKANRLGQENLYLKSDGSLSYGFEIVSHPRDLQSWRTFSDQFGELLLELSDMGMRAWGHNSCGLHVHVSRAGFKSQAHQARFSMLFAQNQQAWIKVAKRSSGYASFPSFRNGGVIHKVKFPGMAGHSDAINLGNTHTIEVRIFRPSLAIGRVLAALEFVHAAVEYTRHRNVADTTIDLSWGQFGRYIIQNDYPHAERVLAGGRFNLRGNSESEGN